MSSRRRRPKAPPLERERGVCWAVGWGGWSASALWRFLESDRGLGIPEYEAKQYEGKILKGNMLISVHTEDGDEVDRAKEIFKREGAQDISYTGEAAVEAR